MVLSMDRWVGKVAVVTGASSGIGAGISEQLVKEGLKVVGLARRKERIEELASRLSEEKGKLYAVKTDVSKEDDIINAFQWIKDNLGPVHILINNAGIFIPANLHDGDTQKWKNILDVNVLGLCIATREAVKSMKEYNVDGHIIYINSIGGHCVPNFPGISFNVYSVSKFAVTALAETLRLELSSIKSKIKVTDLSPGAVNSVNTEIVPDADADKGPSPVHEMIAKKKILQTQDIADAVLYILSTPPHVQIQELMIRPVEDIF